MYDCVADHPTSDIVYNSTTDLWYCCYGSGLLDCSLPSPESFEAPSPQQLLKNSFDSSSLITLSSYMTPSSSSIPSTIDHASVSSNSFSTVTLVSVAVSSILPIPASSTSSGSISYPSGSTYSSPMSTGVSINAKIGIAIAVTLAILGLAILTSIICRRRRRHKRSGNQISERAPIAGIQDDGTPSEDEGVNLAVELSAERSAELDSSAMMELDAVNGI